MNELELETLAQFAREILLPAGAEVLTAIYTDYCDGKDIGIQTKGDNSPASAADREAENAIRYLIQNIYPDHGIWGEEYGTFQLDADWVWILDPLDGTKEFLAKNPHHFGLLIGLFYQGKPAYGLIHDPISDETWGTRIETSTPNAQKSIADATIACTNRSMFEKKDAQSALNAVLDDAQAEHNLMNCIGFAKVADGSIDAVIEADLNLHDIAAILPVLFQSGATVTDFVGKNYKDYSFSFDDYGQRGYDILASHDTKLIEEILGEIQ
ncbi:MAG: inositol monophosphatase family protein [Pseudomonadota bacterium]